MIGDPGRLAKAGLRATFGERPAIKGDRVRFFTAAGADVPMRITRVCTDGNLWVGESRKPGDNQPRWKVSDPDGAYLGVVETPPRFRIFEVGSDYLLGRWHDDLDVEQVQMYGLLKK